MSRSILPSADLLAALPVEFGGSRTLLRFPGPTRSGRRFRITIVSPQPDLSGGQRVIAIYADLLARRGHEVTVVCYGQPRRSPARRLKDALRGRTPATGGAASHYRRLGLTVRRLDHPGPVTAADVPDADVVIATWWRTAQWVADLPQGKGAKLYFMQDYGAPGQEFERLIPTWRLPFRFVTLTHELAGRVAAEAGPDQVHVVRNAVDTAQFFASPGRPRRRRIGYIHKALPTKGAHVAIAALLSARERFADLDLVALGSAPRPADLPDVFTYFRSPSDATLREIYSGCTGWLFPSSMEGFGLPVLEAMACRTPVVGTRVGVAPDVIRDGVNGFLCDPDDPEAMASALCRLLSLPPRRWTRMSEAARASVLGYGWDDAADGFEAAIRAAITDRVLPICPLVAAD